MLGQGGPTSTEIFDAHKRGEARKEYKVHGKKQTEEHGTRGTPTTHKGERRYKAGLLRESIFWEGKENWEQAAAQKTKGKPRAKKEPVIVKIAEKVGATRENTRTGRNGTCGMGGKAIEGRKEKKFPAETLALSRKSKKICALGDADVAKRRR